MYDYLCKMDFEPKNVLDIGAHIGNFTQMCRKVWPLADYYLIEGNEACEPALRYLGEPYFIVLLGDQDGRSVTYYKTTHNVLNTGNSIYRERTPYYSDEKLISEARVLTTLDTLFLGKGIRFDFAKIDTQGSELDILRGGVETLKNCKFMLLEVSLKEYNEGTPLKDEALGFMRDYGYSKFTVIEQHTWTGGVSTYLSPNEIFQEDIIFEKG